MYKKSLALFLVLLSVAACSSVPNPLKRNKEKIGDVVVEEVETETRKGRGLFRNPFRRGEASNEEKDNFKVIRYDEAEEDRHGPSLPSLSLFKRQEGDALSNEVLRDRAWRKVTRITRVQPVTPTTIRVDVNGPIVMSPENLEYILLARAAGETLKRGYSEFAFTHIEYEGGEGLSNLLVPSVSFTERQWIGTYEDLLIARDNQNILGDMGRFGKKSITAVVVLRKPGEEKRRRTFPAEATYINMLNSRLNLAEM